MWSESSAVSVGTCWLLLRAVNELRNEEHPALKLEDTVSSSHSEIIFIIIVVAVIVIIVTCPITCVM